MFSKRLLSIRCKKACSRLCTTGFSAKFLSCLNNLKYDTVGFKELKGLFTKNEIYDIIKVHFIPNLHDFTSSAEHKIRHFENCFCACTKKSQKSSKQH